MKLEPLLYVSDLQKSIKFYVDVLHFKRGKLFPDSKNPTYAPIFIGSDKLMLVTARESNQKFHKRKLGGSGVQLFIQTEDVDNVFKKVKTKVKIIDPIETKPWGDREFTLKDRDGYLVTFYQATETK